MVVLLQSGPDVYYSFDFRTSFGPVENRESEVRYGSLMIWCSGKNDAAFAFNKQIDFYASSYNDFSSLPQDRRERHRLASVRRFRFAFSGIGPHAADIGDLAGPFPLGTPDFE
jgi:hypothetical protein